MYNVYVPLKTISVQFTIIDFQQAQLVLLVILLAAITDFFLGTFVGPKSDIEFARGFVGYNSKFKLIKIF